MTDASQPQTTGSLIRAARRRMGQTQAKFALSMKSQQSLISKYERDQVDPPSALVMQCMTILRGEVQTTVSEDSLVELVRERLSGREHAATRAAIASLIAGVR